LESTVFLIHGFGGDAEEAEPVKDRGFEAAHRSECGVDMEGVIIYSIPGH